MDLNNKISEMEQWNSQFSNKQERLEAVTRIALTERESVYDYVNSLIRNNDRFSLENLMNYSPNL
ncbi:653_t:CDS:2, partial [Entrophospora sp. SA101]